MNKIEFKIIKGNESSEEINEILNEEDMESSIQIKYIKYPTLFESYLHRISIHHYRQVK